MGSKIRAGLAVGAVGALGVVTLVLAVSGATAQQPSSHANGPATGHMSRRLGLAALPPQGDDGDDIERPPPTRPPTTTTTASPRVIQSLAVTTDSVVATATLRYTGSPSLVTVQWGDGTSTSRNPGDPTDSPFPDPWTPSDPPGVSVFTHAYTAPSDGTAFPVSVVAQIGAESQAAAAIITPRYRVTQSAVSLTPLHPCDLPTEPETEWRVDRHGGSFGDRAWEFDLDEPAAWVGDYPGGTHTPPDSVVTWDGTVAAAPEVGYLVTERDLIDDDLGEYTQIIDFDPLLGSRSVSLYYFDIDSPFHGESCGAQVLADIDVRLLTPGLGGGPITRQ